MKWAIFVSCDSGLAPIGHGDTDTVIVTGFSDYDLAENSAQAIFAKLWPDLGGWDEGLGLLNLAEYCHVFQQIERVAE